MGNEWPNAWFWMLSKQRRREHDKRRTYRDDGSEEQAAYALDILLKGIKAPFLRAAIQAELGEIDSEIGGLEADGLIVKTNGTLRVNWQAEDAVFGSEPGAFWSATDEQRQEAERIRERLQKAQSLICRRNRTVSLLAVR